MIRYNRSSAMLMGASIDACTLTASRDKRLKSRRRQKGSHHFAVLMYSAAILLSVAGVVLAR